LSRTGGGRAFSPRIAKLERHTYNATMQYKTRFLEEKLKSLTKTFPAILVTGPRQAGKTSLLDHVVPLLFKEAVETISFDTPSEIDLFRRDPELFFANRPGILFLDEIQHVPDIFPYLKREIDRAPGVFRFFMSGSQHFELMKGVTESLAGRVAVLDLWPFAAQEIRSATVDSALKTIELLENPDRLSGFTGQSFKTNDVDDVVPLMLAGGYPPAVLKPSGGDWLESYRRTYVQRDIRELSQVADLGRFDRFLVLCAGRSGMVINKAEISRVVGVDAKTVDHWLSLLETSYQLITLAPFHENTTKRLVKSPKWVFADAGFGLHLQAIRDGAALLNAPHFGNLFESFVTMEIRKLYGHIGLAWDAFFWRTPQGLECDLVLSVAGRLVPIEVKHATSHTARDLAALNMFIDLYQPRAPHGLLVSMNPKIERIAPRVFNVPLGLILNGLS